MSAPTEALAELRAAGAIALPNPSTLKNAKKGKVFSGKKANGELWTITKNNNDSYNTTC